MTTRVKIAYDVRHGGEPPDPDALADHLDHVMDALMDLDGIIDPDVAATLGRGHVEIAIEVDAADELAAAEVGVAALRSAIRAAPDSSNWASGAARVTAETLT